MQYIIIFDEQFCYVFHQMEHYSILFYLALCSILQYYNYLWNEMFALTNEEASNISISCLYRCFARIILYVYITHLYFDQTN